MNSDLTQKKCVPCEDGTQPLKTDDIQLFASQISEEWEVIEEKKIKRVFTFKNFSQAMKFANTVAGIAEEENHHPNLSISWGRVEISITTHAINGLSENDFILASKVDKIVSKQT